jgi:outer membrane protein assembly factor BamA
MVLSKLNGQNLQLKIKTKDSTQQHIVDSTGYSKSFKNYKTLASEVDSLFQKILRLGYLDAEQGRLSKANDSTYTSSVDLGKRVRSVSIYLKQQLPQHIKAQIGLDTAIDSIEVGINQLENFLSKLNSLVIEEGYPFAKLKLVNIQKVTKDQMSADLEISTNDLRRIDKIVVKGYNKFPKSFIKQFLRIKEGGVFRIEELNAKTEQLSNLIFANQVRDPEILFTTDSTTLYLYIEKRPSNNFDGFLGFGTNEQTNRLELDGYLNLDLINNLNFGESLRISYKSDEIDQQTFDVRLQAPYLFKSPIGAEFGLNIFRKDSTFVTTTQNLKLNYQINPKHTIGVGINAVASSDLLDGSSQVFSDYNSNYYLLNYRFIIPTFSDPLFPVNTFAEFTLGQGNRDSDLGRVNQTKIDLHAFKIFNLNNRNSIYIQTRAGYLISDDYFDNELYRFGGINSIRGFEENSLVANLYGVLNTEYRYRLSSNLFVNSVIDAAYYENRITNVKEQLFGFGFGFGLLTQAGLFRLNYASAKTEGQAFRLSNSKVHISLTARF